MAFSLTSFVTPKRGKFHLIVADQSYWLKGHCLVVYCSGGLCPVYILAVLKTKKEKKIVLSWEHLCLPRIALSFSVMVCSHDHNQGCELSRTAKLLNLYQSYFNKVLGWPLFIIWNMRFEQDSLEFRAYEFLVVCKTILSSI